MTDPTWKGGNTKIGPVLDVKVCYHQERYGVEIMIESFFRDRTVSSVRIVNGINKYATETTEEILVASVGDRSTGKLVAKARPRPTPTFTLSPVSIPYRERKWVDIEPGPFSQDCFEMSKFIIRLLRHDESVHRKEDGVVRFDNLAELFKSRFCGYFALGQFKLGKASWEKEEGKRKGFSTAWILILPNIFLYSEQSKDIQEILLLMLDNVLLPDDFAVYIYHVGNAHDMHSIIQCGLIPGGKSLKKDKQSVCFSQPWTRCTPIRIKKKFNTIWTNPELRCTKILG